jgi:ATP-dependent Clp protease ATP-binding subunit ClpA
MMVEPSNDLQLIFDKAISVANTLKHEYVTIEHLVFSMLCEEKFYNSITAYGANAASLKKKLEIFLKIGI